MMHDSDCTHTSIASIASKTVCCKLGKPARHPERGSHHSQRQHSTCRLTHARNERKHDLGKAVGRACQRRQGAGKMGMRRGTQGTSTRHAALTNNTAA